MPPAITTSNSLFVISETKGFTSSGASVWPTKMLAAVESVSAPLVRIVFCMAHAMPRITTCISPRW